MIQTAFRVPKLLLNECKVISKEMDSDLSKEVRKMLGEFREKNKKHLEKYESIDGEVLKVKA